MIHRAVVRIAGGRTAGARRVTMHGARLRAFGVPERAKR